MWEKINKHQRSLFLPKGAVSPFGNILGVKAGMVQVPKGARNV
ncbi:MAG: hypothetical protein O4965_14680 [Trichodesmium sp. St19_bin1]|nr:hypothetical protein [Trichodesmium sp. St2_bin2_1]MDE5121263.1 hypothetical protein [Trichodesmium sp. St19_bin1]